jgi:hypothetical protein
MGRVVKIVLVGLAWGGAAGVLSLVVEIALLVSPLYFQFAANEGSGGLGAVSAPIIAPYVAMLGFVVGAWRQFRRSRSA